MGQRTPVPLVLFIFTTSLVLIHSKTAPKLNPIEKKAVQNLFTLDEKIDTISAQKKDKVDTIASNEEGVDKRGKYKYHGKPCKPKNCKVRIPVCVNVFVLY